MNVEAEQVRQIAVAAMNRGHALAQIHSETSLREAAAAYAEAIALLRPLAEEPANANSLGAALMNRGRLLHQADGIRDSDTIEEDFEEAYQVLSRHLPSKFPWIHRNLAGTLINHANLLLDLGRANAAYQKGVVALQEVPNSDELVDAELKLLSYRTLCDCIGQILPNVASHAQANYVDMATEYLEAAFTLLESIPQQVRSHTFEEAPLRLFRFGARMLAVYQPQKLEPYIKSRIRFFDTTESIRESREVAGEAITQGVDTLSKMLFQRGISPEEQDSYTHTATSLYRLSDIL